MSAKEMFEELLNINHSLQQKVEQLEKENKELKEENKRIFQNVNDDELLISNAMNYAEVQRLNNIINELEKELREGSFDVYFCSTNTQKTFKSNEIIIKSLILDKLKELKENNNGK